ncbi:Secreted protein containing C-terminal beta-propeller domain [Halorientalis persicus]|uniref:Secreted protein containing C-terminal beta-propeller domain n=1 Tax=Halorientalis persicus TaxID=1367881 RepID=A0A1H8IJ99_9EURY|nr:beta-propeller domain-containing protein [Halorientalis persicus]SEN68345.1 Secreted protein containing C-terminal beta-propeller domain [Halorientalis persicus]
MERTRLTKTGFAVVVITAVVVAGALALGGATTRPPADVANDSDGAPSDNATVTQFESEAAVAAYVQRGQRLAAVDTPFRVRRVRFTAQPTAVSGEPTLEQPMPARTDTAESESASGGAGSESAPERVSNTNVQVAGLQEPDILKTDGRHVYYSAQRQRFEPWGEPRRPDYGDDETNVLSATPPEAPEEIGSIDASGRLLQVEDTLVVIENDAVRGYDVSDPAAPTQVWTHPLEDEVVTARERDGRLYLVTRSSVSVDDPCPVEPLGGDAAIGCDDIYRPTRQVPVDATYSALALDAENGAVGDAISFVGTQDDTAVYMSNRSLYVTYTERSERGERRVDFLLERQADRLPPWAVDRLEEIQGYNISATSKEREANRILGQYLATLNQSKRDRVASEIRNDYRSYLGANQRDLLTTGIVRVGVDGTDLAVETVGTVPGRPLNQFSLSEEAGTLRITTTVPAAGSAQSANDLYTLDAESLDRLGAAKGMGLNEEVFAVRYVGDTAYVVTFRRVDPFHVVDVSDPRNPEEVGKLELPGFSSYLHPVDENHVLGIGQEDGQVKAVLFDVSDTSDPTIDDDRLFGAGWSAISETHHAFLLDRRHEVFFLPTGQGGKIVDYSDGDLALKTTVDTDGAATRAMYVDDFMYVFGRDELVVVDERTWNRTRTVALEGS